MELLITEPQVSFIERLVEERPANHPYVTLVREKLASPERESITRSAASDIITALKGIKREAPAVPAVPPAPEGMHRLGTDIYKVQRAIHGSGNLYAKKLTPTRDCEGHESTGTGTVTYCDGSCRPLTEATWSFEYAPGAVRKLAEDTLLTIEEAKSFGKLYGSCAVCGRTLTDEASISAGIGPICAKRF